jgi:hypothetical protein
MLDRPIVPNRSAGASGGWLVVAGVGYCFSPPQDGDLSGMAGCPSGQRERSVKSSAEAYVGSNPTPATTRKLASDKARCLLAVIRFRLCSVIRPRVVDCAPGSVFRIRHQMPVRLEHERRVLMAQPLGDCDHRLAGCQEHAGVVVAQCVTRRATGSSAFFTAGAKIRAP